MEKTDQEFWPALQPSAIRLELCDAPLGDRRLSKRVETVGISLAENPGESIPKALSNSADREAAYRLFNNDKTTPQLVLEPHYKRTVGRAATTNGSP